VRPNLPGLDGDAKQLPQRGRNRVAALPITYWESYFKRLIRL